VGGNTVEKLVGGGEKKLENRQPKMVEFLKREEKEGSTLRSQIKVKLMYKTGNRRKGPFGLASETKRGAFVQKDVPLQKGWKVPKDPGILRKTGGEKSPSPNSRERDP